MAPCALAALSLAALLAAAAGHFEAQDAGRRLTYSSRLQHIWGRRFSCASQLSDGPEDADIELRLGGLPPSTAGRDVHLQWWSARKSPTRYDPLSSPVNCSVYRCVRHAYPHFWEDEFNGGNVRVSADGEALIRIRSPATYFVWQYIAIPHIHLRLCVGSSKAQRVRDAIMIDGPNIWVSSSRGGGAVRVLAAHPYARRSISASSSTTTAVRPVAIIVGVEDCRCCRSQTGPGSAPTTTLPEATTTRPYDAVAELSAAATTSATGTRTRTTRASTTTRPGTTTITATETATTTARLSTTGTATATAATTTTTVTATDSTTTHTTTITDPPTTTLTQADDVAEVMIQDARDALDLDALEFSPIYNCLLEQKFYDHFSGDCAEACPASAAAAHGQCVRAETPEPEARLQTSWMLSVKCGEPCWHSKKNATLHDVRLSFAGHLRIPFQEVELSWGFEALGSRRLSAGLRHAHLTVKVSSNRITTEETRALMSSYAQDAASMSDLLGLDVREVARGATPDQQEDSDRMDQGSDPYVPAYSAIENPSAGRSPPSGPLGFLPMEAVSALAVAVVVSAAVFWALLVWHRRRQHEAASKNQTYEDKVAELGELKVFPMPEKLAWSNT